VIINLKKLDPAAKIPSRRTPGAAGYDVYASAKAYILPGETYAVRTGLSMEIPEGWKGEVYSRSGLTLKGIVVANQPGKIDSDYRGEIFVLLHNFSRGMYEVEIGDRIAQLEINPVYEWDFVQVEDMGETDRGEGGLGSTGK
tara:strand:- start:539 stop:964 length:426 start_codon:yes stop_codon:yes gene_type:complete